MPITDEEFAKRVFALFMDNRDQFDREGFEDDFGAVICARFGHEIIDDHCCRDDHRFCWRCRETRTKIAAAGEFIAKED